MKFELLLRGGTAIDPSSKLEGIRDIAVDGEKIVAVEPQVAAEAKQVYDIAGCIVSPGLIDFHTHVYWPNGVNADLLGPRTSVCTFVDFGSTGPGNFKGFLEHVISQSKVRILAFLHIAYTGLAGYLRYSAGPLMIVVGELEDLRRAILEPVIEVGERYPGIIRGIKVRASANATGSNWLQAILLAKQAAEALGKPLAIHIGRSPPGVKDVLPHLRGGDILTHCLRGPVNSLLNRDGDIVPEALEARERGVLFDVGHGLAGFSFDVAAHLIRQGFPPDIISSDVHTLNVDKPGHDLPGVMSKFLALGFNLREVVQATTHVPAKALGMEGELGSLRVGGMADISVFKLEKGAFQFSDATGKKFAGDTQIVPVMTIRGGRVLEVCSRELQTTG